VTTLLESSSFWIAAGVAVGVVAALVVAHALTRRWWGGAGIVAAIGALVGLAADFDVPIELVGGIVLLGLAASVGARWSRALGAVASVPGAALVGLAVQETTPAPDWVAVSVAVAAGAASTLVVDLDELQPRVVGLCLAMASAGVYATLPDTETAGALLGAAAVSAIMGLVPNVRAAPAGSAAALGVLLWSVGVGGWGRESAVIGGIACVGVLVLGLFIRWMRTPPLAVVLAQVGLVAVVARVAGLRDSRGQALAIVAATYVVALIALWLAGRIWPAAQRSRRAAASSP
jgi:hypothetical protein